MVSASSAGDNERPITNTCVLFYPSKLTIYIINLDPNYMYGKAMTYPRPQPGFKSVTGHKGAKLNWLAQ